jgi:hypothetical protein
VGTGFPPPWSRGHLRLAGRGGGVWPRGQPPMPPLSRTARVCCQCLVSWCEAHSSVSSHVSGTLIPGSPPVAMRDRRLTRGDLPRTRVRLARTTVPQSPSGRLPGPAGRGYRWCAGRSGVRLCGDATWQGISRSPMRLVPVRQRRFRLLSADTGRSRCFAMPPARGGAGRSGVEHRGHRCGVQRCLGRASLLDTAPCLPTRLFF